MNYLLFFFLSIYFFDVITAADINLEITTNANGQQSYIINDVPFVVASPLLTTQEAILVEEYHEENQFYLHANRQLSHLYNFIPRDPYYAPLLGVGIGVIWNPVIAMAVYNNSPIRSQVSLITNAFEFVCFYSTSIMIKSRYNNQIVENYVSQAKKIHVSLILASFISCIPDMIYHSDVFFRISLLLSILTASTGTVILFLKNY